MTCCLLLLPLWESVIVLCFVCTLLYVLSSFAIILMGKRELDALLSLSSWCLVIVVWLFLAVPWVCLQFVIVVFPDHTRLLFLSVVYNSEVYEVTNGSIRLEKKNTKQMKLCLWYFFTHF